MKHQVAYLISVEPSALPRDAGVEVYVHEDKGDHGFDQVRLTAATPDALYAYVREHWGEEDPAWMQDNVIDASYPVVDADAGEREMLVHLNVIVPGDDDRDADQVAAAILAALEVGSDDDSVRGLHVEAPLAEEI